jgi:hypothetical protein
MITPPAAPDRFELFGQALTRLSSALERVLHASIPAIAAELENVGEAQPERRLRQALYAAGTMLRIEARTRAAEVVRALDERAHKCLEYLRRAGGEERALALIQDEELRTQIVAAEIARALRESAGADYERCAARVRALMPGLWQDDDLNPLGARSVAAAALAAFGDLGEAEVVAGALRMALLSRLTPGLAGAFEELGAWLAGEGVEPLSTAADQPPPPPAATPWPIPTAPDGRPDASPPEPPDAASAATGSDAGQAKPQRTIDVTAQAADAARVLGSSPFATAEGPPKLNVLLTLQPVVEIERDAVAFAHAIGALPYSRRARGEFFGNVRSRLRAAGVQPTQLYVVDLVAAMFDYVVDDRRVPEAAKPLIWRLQQPTVALALLDPSYLGDEPRSLRRLVENLGAIINAFSEDLTRGSELFRRLDTVVRAVEIVAGALQTRSAVMARQVEHEYSRAARNVAQLIERVVQERTSLESTPARRNRRDYRRRPGRDREQEVTERLSRMLAERLERHHVPESVREFVLNVWLRHLRTAALRDGEESAEFKVALEVVDDLLWSLDGSKERQSRRALAQKIPPLIRVLTQGLREIGAKDEEFKPFFDELFLIHLRKMQRRVRANGSGGTRTTDRGEDTGFGGFGTTGTSGDVTFADRRPAPPDAPPVSAPADAESEGTDRKLLEVLASLDLGDLPQQPRALELDADRALATLRRGDWLRLAGRDGAPVFAKVAWINARRTVVLMVRHPDRRALSMRAGELQERFARGRASRIA